MPLTTAQRVQVVSRLIVKVQTGQVELEELATAIVSGPAAVGEMVQRERDQWVADLAAARQAALAQAAQIEAEQQALNL